jgi:hypothetical protein
MEFGDQAGADWMRRCKMFMKLSTFSVYIELEWHFWVRYQWQDSQVVQSEKMQDMHLCFFFSSLLGHCEGFAIIVGRCGRGHVKDTPHRRARSPCNQRCWWHMSWRSTMLGIQGNLLVLQASLWSNHEAGCQRGVYSNTQFARHTFGLALRFTSMDSKMNDQNNENICFNLNHGHHFLYN